MKIITAQEIKRRGISAVDNDLKNGPVHIIKNNKPQYVVLDEKTYANLISEREENYSARIRQSLDDIKKGNVQSFNNPDELFEAIENITD